jgi:hypothetical protein
MIYFNLHSIKIFNANSKILKNSSKQMTQDYPKFKLRVPDVVYFNRVIVMCELS